MRSTKAADWTGTACLRLIGAIVGLDPSATNLAVLLAILCASLALELRAARDLAASCAYAATALGDQGVPEPDMAPFWTAVDAELNRLEHGAVSEAAGPLAWNLLNQGVPPVTVAKVLAEHIG